MGKKSKKNKKLAAQSWSRRADHVFSSHSTGWYCDRTFEDDKVLLQHQKSKHFRCPHCPRRLNTAGGLTVHIDQVHKLGQPDRIENALPGRDTFEVEIYGMEGIPAADLAEWKKKQEEEMGVTAEQQRSKKPKYDHRPLSASEIRAQLAQHKALMSGQPLPPAPGQFRPPPPQMQMPPHGQPMMPPGFFNGPSYGGPPPPQHQPPHNFSAPPPNFSAPPPGFIPPPPPGFPGFPTGLPAPPPGFVAPPSGFLPPPGFSAPPFLPPPPGMHLPPGMPMPPPFNPAIAALPVPKPKEKLPSSAVELKPGTLLVYGDNDVSIEEKRARLAQYRVEIQKNPQGQDVGGITAAVNEASRNTGETRQRERAADLM
ncbi:BQ2448_5388 [Microbotryum intermedium]|uniref:BQ2448_5388 protein n=1 Tax=Microbotryum intermedium TaxID=269621 RepID=A0A238F423_9BASI|nr:BQ2448_5388 [Microbotryum intermedium]